MRHALHQFIRGTEARWLRLKMMKFFSRNGDAQAGLSPLLMIVAVLAIGALAKSGTAISLLHLAR
jgi:hypothetical protein